MKEYDIDGQMAEFVKETKTQIWLKDKEGNVRQFSKKTQWEVDAPLGTYVKYFEEEN